MLAIPPSVRLPVLHHRRLTSRGAGHDRDAREPAEEAFLSRIGVYVLPVAEVENLFLLPAVIKVIGKIEGYSSEEIDAKFVELKNAIFGDAARANNMEAAVVEYCKRRIDQSLKVMSFEKATTAQEVARCYYEKTEGLDVNEIAVSARRRIETAINDKDLDKLLEFYSNKGLLSHAARIMKSTSRSHFEQWICRALMNRSHTSLSTALSEVLPEIAAAC